MKSNSRKRTDVERALLRKGFTINDADHERFQYISLAGKKTFVWTKVSRGKTNRDIGVPNLSNMAKQCHLTNSEFDDLVDCPLSREHYEQLLCERVTL